MGGGRRDQEHGYTSGFHFVTANMQQLLNRLRWHISARPSIIVCRFRRERFLGGSGWLRLLLFTLGVTGAIFVPAEDSRKERHDRQRLTEGEVERQSGICGCHWVGGRLSVGFKRGDAGRWGGVEKGAGKWKVEDERERM